MVSSSMATADADCGVCRSWCSCWLPPPPIQKSGNRSQRTGPLHTTLFLLPGFTAAACTCSCIARTTPTSPTSACCRPNRNYRAWKARNEHQHHLCQKGFTLKTIRHFISSSCRIR